MLLIRPCLRIGRAGTQPDLVCHTTPPARLLIRGVFMHMLGLDMATNYIGVGGRMTSVASAARPPRRTNVPQPHPQRSSARARGLHGWEQRIRVSSNRTPLRHASHDAGPRDRGEREEGGGGHICSPGLLGSAVLPRTGEGKYLHLTGPLENVQVTSGASTHSANSPASEVYLSLVFNHAAWAWPAPSQHF